MYIEFYWINWLQVSVPRVIQRLVNALSLQEPQSKFSNESNKKSKTLSTTKKTFSPQVSCVLPTVYIATLSHLISFTSLLAIIPPS